MSLLLQKYSTIGPDSAFDYICDPFNSLGKRKGKFKNRLMIFGPPNIETAKLLVSLRRKKKKTLIDKLADLLESERQKSFAPTILYSLLPLEADEQGPKAHEFRDWQSFGLFFGLGEEAKELFNRK